MKKNVGDVDVIIRVILGLGIIGLGILLQSWWGLIGILPLATGFFGICPLYSLFGISTCATKNKK